MENLLDLGMTIVIVVLFWEVAKYLYNKFVKKKK